MVRSDTSKQRCVGATSVEQTATAVTAVRRADTGGAPACHGDPTAGSDTVGIAAGIEHAGGSRAVTVAGHEGDGRGAGDADAEAG
jgi:hypothetical protein